MQRFKSPGQAQRFLSAYGPISYFRPKRYLFTAPDYRQEMRKRFVSWRGVIGLQVAV